jgi:hypothetical protein
VSWIPLAERFPALPLILAGPILRRTEPRAVTVWVALKEPETVTLRIYTRDDTGYLAEKFEGTHHTVRLGDNLHIVAVTARASANDEPLAWGALYYYDLFFQADVSNDVQLPALAAHLGTPGVLDMDPSSSDPLKRLVYPGHPLPSFVLPPQNLNQLKIIHGSCRKPHGVGKEMLSALDTIIEDTAINTTQRPQQLFLTGDQIYADDVAKPLLAALTDAGNFLFSGNQEEVLPLVNVPASMLASVGRTDAVRNKAMFTTEHSENHLLSLAEYAAMYLFAWSDILWPGDLPVVEHAWTTNQEGMPVSKQQIREEELYMRTIAQLRQFQSTLPRVRRALANIATYMICDDHDVTDDWFLDGEWCHKVLGNDLGRRIIRNGLLTYALFQSWGNTPGQFDKPNGTALLQAVNTWRGDESDEHAATIAEVIGLPRPFEGSGELQRSGQSLQWHYSFSGLRYQVIVMDSRTRRIYLSPNEFPGLLSPEAIATQVVAFARKDVDVTLIVSATPVLGVDLMETIQLWSRVRLKENYTFDREAWALERLTYQNFLKAIGPMQRVVVLSGDVHYAFGSSLEYWDYHTRETAKIVNYTSSPLRNEGAGAQLAILTVVYPRLFRLLGRGDIPKISLFAWDVLPDHDTLLEKMLDLIRLRVFDLWWSVPRYMDLRRSPHALVFPAQGWPVGAFNAFPPDRSYRLHYLHHGERSPHYQDLRAVKEKAQVSRITFSRWLLVQASKIVDFFQWRLLKGRNKLASRTAEFQKERIPLPRRISNWVGEIVKNTELLERELEKREKIIADAIVHREEWLERLKAGMNIVGYNNIGEISFEWSLDQKNVIQRLWWWHPDNTEKPTPATQYSDTLELPAFDAAPPLP